MVEDEIKKGFVWYSLRISLFLVLIFTLIFLWLNIVVMNSNSLFRPKPFFYILLVITPFNFLISLVHLFMYKQKALAITSLILSFSSAILVHLMSGL